MPTFTYRARDPEGQEVTGTLVADSPLAAARMLDERTLYPVEVSEVPAGGKSLFGSGPKRVGLSKVGVVYEQLADLLRAGVPVLRALSVLSHQASSQALSRVLREVHDDVAGGETLADAMEKHPYVFPHLHVAMIRAGEKGGFLEDVLSRLSDFVIRQDELRNKFVGSMIYPCVLMLGAIGAVAGLMTFVVPRIKVMLMDQELPWASKVVFALSDLIGQHYLVIAAVLMLLFMAGYGFVQSEVGRMLWARLQLKAPGIGRIYTMVSLCRFCRILGTLLANGIPVLSALRIAKDSTGNPILAETIEQAAESVSAGEPLTKPLAASKVFPPALIDMLAVAEESNTLEKVLLQIADTQEARTARQIDLFVRLLEPALLLCMGAMVMFIAVALLLPIVRMATAGFH